MKSILDAWLEAYYASRPQIQAPQKSTFDEYLIPRNIRDPLELLRSENEKLKSQLLHSHDEDAGSWKYISNGHYPALGEKVILRLNNVVQHEIYTFDQGDNDFGLGEYFWSRDDIDECPAMNEGDAWRPLDSL